MLLVWALLVIHAAWYVARYGSPVATRDDMELLPAFLSSATPKSILLHFWQPLNEHRIVLSQYLHFAAVSVTRDFRAGGYVQVGLLAAAALLCIATVRRLRGGTRIEDVLFPLLLLHWSNGENLLLGTQICVALAVLLATIAACALVWSPSAPSARRIAIVGACVVLLPWCGGFGLCPSPIYVAWIALAGLAAWRAGRKAIAAQAIAWCVAYGGCIVLYFTDFTWPPSPPLERRLDIGAGIVVQVLSMTFGGLAPYEPWVSVPASLALLACAISYIARGLRRTDGERWTAVGLAVVLGGVLLLAASIAWSRQSSWPYSGWAARYSLAPSPLAMAAVFGVIVFGGRIAARAVPIGLALLLLAAMPLHMERGRWMAAQVDVMMRPFLAAVRENLPIEDLAHMYQGQLYPDEVGLRVRLDVMRSAHLPPFELTAPPESSVQAGLVSNPEVLETAAPALERRLSGLPFTGVLAPARLVVPLPSTARSASGSIAVLPFAYLPHTASEEHTLGIRVRVVQEREGEAPVHLRTLTLDPGTLQSDRGPRALEFALAPGGGRLVIHVESVSTDRPGTDWLGVGRFFVQ